MNAPVTCRTVLVEDTPAAEDAFGTHDRVADALADLICSSTAGGKIIGLEGGWGAGKTTVIKLLESMLHQSDRCRVVTFDTWAHEGDPLRRTFLESLIADLQRVGWAKKEEWDQKLEEIARRRSEKTTKTVPKPTTLGKFLALSVLPVPFGSQIVMSALRDGARFWGDLTDPISWRLIIGTVLSLGWFFVLLGNGVRLGWHKFVQNKKTEDPWSFLLSEAITTQVTTTVDTPEPTSVEFDQYFTTLLEQAIGADQSRRLVLVLDNLDRVDQEHALALWSTLQTFLQDRHRGETGWFARLWVIVPYDPNGLRQLWRLDSPEMISPDVDEEEALPFDKPAQYETSDFFLDKVFCLRLHVPRLLLKNWREHVLELAAQAFPDHRDREELRPLLLAFELDQRKTRQPPTPRDLKVYINQVGAIHRQWGHEFPWAHVGYYALIARRRMDIPAGLLAGRIPERNVTAALPSGLTASLAGMHFNVDKVTGQQLLLEEPIYTALKRPDPNELMNLAEVHQDGFWSVLAYVASTRFFQERGTIAARAASCLADAQLPHDHAEFLGVRDAIIRSMREESDWSRLDDITARGVAAACRLESDSAFSKALTKRVAKSQLSGAEETAPVDPPTLVEGWLAIIDTVDKLGHEEAARTVVHVNCEDAEGWVAACVILGEADPARWKCFQPATRSSEPSKYFAALVERGDLDEAHLSAILVTAGTATPPDLKGVLAAVRTRLDASSNPNVSPSEAMQVLRCLLELRDLGVEEDPKEAKTFDEAGHYLHHLERQQSSPDPAGTALCVFLSLLARPGAGKPPTVGNSDAGHAHLIRILGEADEDIVGELCNLARRFGSLDKFLDIRRTRKEWDPLVAACIRTLARGQNAASFFEIASLVGNWSVIDSAFNEDNPTFADLVSIVDDDGRLGNAIMEGPFAILDTGLYCAVADREGCADAFLLWCKEGLEQAPLDDWTEALDDKNYGVELLLDLAELGHCPDLEASFIDAQIEHAGKLVDGQQPHRGSDHWATLLGALRQGLRAEFRRRLLEFAFDRRGSFSKAFFAVFGDELKLCDGLLTESDTPSKLFGPLVRTPILKDLPGFVI